MIIRGLLVYVTLHISHLDFFYICMVSSECTEYASLPSDAVLVGVLRVITHIVLEYVRDIVRGIMKSGWTGSS